MQSGCLETAYVPYAIQPAEKEEGEGESGLVSGWVGEWGKEGGREGVCEDKKEGSRKEGREKPL